MFLMIIRNALLSRISACVVIFVLVLALIALQPSESTNLANMNIIKNVIEYEDFESYPLGVFNGGGKWHLYYISEPYYPSRQMIVNKAHVSPSKALYLESAGDEDTIAGVMARMTFNSSASVIGYQVFVMPVNEHIINIEFASEFKSIGNEFDNCYPYGTVEFSGGRIYVWSWDEDAGEYKRLFLKNYSPGKWYNVTVIYFKPVMTFYLWINNELQGTYRDPLLFRTGNIDSLLLECLFGGRAYFDDVIIFSNEPKTETTVTLSSAISLVNLNYEDRVPNSLIRILEFLDVRDTALYGDLYVTLEPIKEISEVYAEIKLIYLPIKDLHYLEFWGTIPNSQIERRVIKLHRSGDKFTATIDVHTLYPASLLSFLSLLSQKSVKEALIRQIGEGMFLPRKLYIYITGEEPVYVSAEITSIKVKDKLGNERIFSVNIKLKTMFEKLYEAWTGKPYFYVYAFSPVGLSVVDGEGRRVGLYHGKIYQEIPNARYHKDKYGTQLIVIAEPEGNMKIEIEALESGSYTLVSGYIEDGTLTKYLLEVGKSIREGETNTFSVDLPRKRHEVEILALIILVMAVVISVIVMVVLYLRRKTRDLISEEIDWDVGIDWDSYRLIQD